MAGCSMRPPTAAAVGLLGVAQRTIGGQAGALLLTSRYPAGICSLNSGVTCSDGRKLMLKIAQIAPLCEAVPPLAYGGTERVVAYLCDALLDLGCDVTLFASADSRTRAKLVPMRARALRLDGSPLKSELAAHLTMLKQVRTL